METTPAHLTPEQLGLLRALAEQTGKAPQEVLDEVFDQVRARVRPDSLTQDTGGSQTSAPAPKTKKPLWERLEEISREVPEEDIEHVPTDLAAQVDHYIYGTPKR
jgi:hypothetical protein